jgi:hypothetical protein
VTSSGLDDWATVWATTCAWRCEEPNEVLVSQTVKGLVAGSGLSFEGAGEHELEGVPDRWQLYRVVS